MKLLSSPSSETLIALALSLGLGLLMGMQRERTQAMLDGVRTYPIIALCGAMLALISEFAGGWGVAAGLVAPSAALVVGAPKRVKKAPALQVRSPLLPCSF